MSTITRRRLIADLIEQPGDMDEKVHVLSLNDHGEYPIIHYILEVSSQKIKGISLRIERDEEILYQPQECKLTDSQRALAKQIVKDNYSSAKLETMTDMDLINTLINLHL